MQPARIDTPPFYDIEQRCTLWLCALGIPLAAVAVGVAYVFTRLLSFITNLAFFGRMSAEYISPWNHTLGAIIVGVIGYIAPRTLGVGYSNITEILAGHITGTVLLMLVTLKFVSWSIALGSGTSGGTLAPLFTIGGGLGALLGTVIAQAFPTLGVDPRIAALVGMAAIFAGASRALLTSIVFAFETTRQPIGLLPLLGGCSAAFMISSLMMHYTIMTEKLARRGTHVPTEYIAAHPDDLARYDAGSVRTRHLRFNPPRRTRRTRETEIL